MRLEQIGSIPATTYLRGRGGPWSKVSLSDPCVLSTPSYLPIESWPSCNVMNLLMPPDQEQVTIGKNSSKGHRIEGAANRWSPNEQL